MENVVDTGLIINNTCSLKYIPYSFLTRPEKNGDELISLNDLYNMNLHGYSRGIFPYNNQEVIDDLKLDYQILCNEHIKEILLNNQEKYIYISMQHATNTINKTYKNFIVHNYHKQLHLILEVLSYNDENINVKPVIINNIDDFLEHQKIARIKEKQFNLKYNIKDYIHCPYCFPTMCSTYFYYKELHKSIPTKKSSIDKEFKKAFILIRHDRIKIDIFFNLTLKKWKCDSYNSYINKLNFIGLKYNWDFNAIITYIHTNHYNIYKSYERINEKKYDNDWNIKKKSSLQRECSINWRANKD
jgi:hypothetical protein